MFKQYHSISVYIILTDYFVCNTGEYTVLLIIFWKSNSKASLTLWSLSGLYILFDWNCMTKVFVFFSSYVNAVLLWCDLKWTFTLFFFQCEYTRTCIHSNIDIQKKKESKKRIEIWWNIIFKLRKWWRKPLIHLKTLMKIHTSSIDDDSSFNGNVKNMKWKWKKLFF